jgi:hypothetical protein
LVAIDYFCIFAAMNVANIILILLALAFALGCFAAAVVRYRADKTTVERWKQNAELWYAYQAQKKAEKKKQKALKKLVKSMRRPSPLPWER